MADQSEQSSAAQSGENEPAHDLRGPRSAGGSKAGPLADNQCTECFKRHERWKESKHRSTRVEPTCRHSNREATKSCQACVKNRTRCSFVYTNADNEPVPIAPRPSGFIQLGTTEPAGDCASSAGSGRGVTSTSSIGPIIGHASRRAHLDLVYGPRRDSSMNDTVSSADNDLDPAPRDGPIASDYRGAGLFGDPDSDASFLATIAPSAGGSIVHPQARMLSDDQQYGAQQHTATREDGTQPFPSQQPMPSHPTDLPFVFEPPSLQEVAAFLAQHEGGSLDDWWSQPPESF